MSIPTPKKRVSTSKGTKLLKQVQSLATEQEGNKLIKDLEKKINNKSDIQKAIEKVNSISQVKLPPKLMQQAKGYEHKIQV